MPAQASLRELYTTPVQSWSFPHMDSAYPRTIHSQTSVLSTHPHRAKIFNPSLTEEYFGDRREVYQLDRIAIQKHAKHLIAYFVLQYASVGLIMPFEVAKVLLQVQWVPKLKRGPKNRDIFSVVTGGSDHIAASDESRGDGEVSLDLDNVSTALIKIKLSDEASLLYFQEPSALHIETTSFKKVNAESFRNSFPALSNGDVNSITGYVMPSGASDGVWQMMKRLSSWKTEGYLSLWKGLLTATIQETLAIWVQPLILSLLYTLSPNSFLATPPYSMKALVLPVISHALTSYALMPLDVLRTRLIVQPAVITPTRLPTGVLPLKALQQTAIDSGGFYVMYSSPHLAYPALLDGIVRPLLSLSGPLIINHMLGLHPPAHSLLRGLAEFGHSTTSLLFTLPIETMKRRLHLQRSSSDFEGGSLATCVTIRPTPYRGCTDCLWKIVTEEGSPSKASPSLDDAQETQRDAKLTVTRRVLNGMGGIGQMYRGFGMSVSASLIVLVLGIITGDRMDREVGWAEL